MKIYLVGGAVRDTLLGKDVKEKDFVVVGSSVAEMLALGFKEVGKDFPVFLHPLSHEEYALARTERKTGIGYHGFTCFFSEDTTLEEDLRRRDLTINAMAMDEHGKVIDPYHGADDLAKKCLRHVSEAFAQDPLRVLRVARFQAHLPDFHIAPETHTLLLTMVQAPDFPTLRRERVYLELKKTLRCAAPWLFFDTLQSIGGLFLVMRHADTGILRKNLRKLVALSEEHLFAGLLFAQSASAIQALQQLPLSRREMFLSKKYQYLENMLDTPQGWLEMLQRTDGLRMREGLRILIATHDALTGNHRMAKVNNIWHAVDALVFPTALSGHNAETIKEHYQQQLLHILHNTV